MEQLHLQTSQEIHYQIKLASILTKQGFSEQSFSYDLAMGFQSLSDF